MVIILNFLFKTAGDINHGYSPLKLFCRRSCQFFLFYWRKIFIPYSCCVCKTVGMVDIGHYFESFTAATTTWLTVMEYLCHKWPRIYFNGRKQFSVLSSFMTYQRILPNCAMARQWLFEISHLLRRLTHDRYAWWTHGRISYNHGIYSFIVVYVYKRFFLISILW
jgi:hypothetical protein